MNNVMVKAVAVLSLVGLLSLFAPVLLAAQQTNLATQSSEQEFDDLTFKILLKQAAEYEQALSALMTKKLAKYVPEDRFHLSVRIYFKPNELQQMKQKSTLTRKSGKLPGFPVFVKEEEKGLDYYLGAGSVMKLKVEVLIDETLPKKYHEFINQLVPIQARFVPKRGDTVNVMPIPFPAVAKKALPADKELPLTTDDASAALMDSIEKGKKSLEEIEPVILHPVLQKYISDYEKFMSEKLKIMVSEYVEKKNFLLSVKFYWNPGEVNKLKKLVTKSDTDGKVKLPGFTIFLEERDAIYEMIAKSTTLLRMEISIMLDEAVSPEVEPFMKKLIPMSIKIVPKRGDKLTIFRGHFPRVGADFLTGRKGDKALRTDLEFSNEINQAFYQGDYRRGLVLVDLLLSKKTDPYERLPLLKKKGTFHLLLNEKELAKAAWEQVRRINPDSSDTVEFLEHLR
jgi:hypothetical protein